MEGAYKEVYEKIVLNTDRFNLGDEEVSWKTELLAFWFHWRLIFLGGKRPGAKYTSHSFQDTRRECKLPATIDMVPQNVTFSMFTFLLKSQKPEVPY